MRTPVVKASCVANTTYYEVDSLRSSFVSRTLSGDHEDRVTDTGGMVLVSFVQSVDNGGWRCRQSS